MQEFVSKSLEDTQIFAHKWLVGVSGLQKGKDVEGALTVGLSGHLGAGKTAFVKAVARELGIAEEITSPTFVIMKIYNTKNKTFKKLVHIDAYRLDNKEDMAVLALHAHLKENGTLIMIEWPENVGFKGDIELEFEALDKSSIRIKER